jgi:hypothetical protein
MLLRIVLISAAALMLAMALSRGRGKILLRHDTFQQFRSGELEDGGANTYISARGAIQLVNRWDYNNDGNIDLLFVGNHDHSENLDAWLYVNSESGFSGKRRTPIPANGGRWALIRDLNGDGIPEIVIANTDNGTIGDLDSFVYWGSSLGYSTQHRTELPTIFSGAPAAADLNHDGYVDLVFPNGGTALLHPGDEVFHRGSFIYWGGKDGYRKDRMTELPTHNAVAALVADLDGDGWDDVVFANTATAEDSGRFRAGDAEERAGDVAQSYIYWGGANGFSPERRTSLATEQAIMARAQDLDEDGHKDLLFLDRRGIVVFRNAGGRRFEAGVVPETTASNSFAIGDLNHDGHADLVLTGKATRVLFGDGRGRFAHGPDLPAHNPHGCEIADLNGDGLPDVIVADNNDGSVFETASFIYWNGPAGLDAARRTELPTSGAQSAAIGDVDGDGRPDLIFLNTLGGHVKRTPTYIYFGNERGEYSTGRRRVIETDGANDGASADLNDDSYTDLLLTQNLRLKPEALPKEIASGAIRERDGSVETQPIYWGASDAFEKLRTTYLPMFGSYGASVADLNRDGYLDIVLSGYFRRTGEKTDRSRIYYGSKNGYSLDHYQDLDAPGAEPSLIADFNRDGWPDIVFPNRKTGAMEGSMLYYGGPDGFSKERSVLMQTAHTTRAQAADLNGDGWLDLIFSNQIENGSQFTPTLIYWGGADGFSTERRTSLPTWGGYGICVADYNRDGFLDLAIPTYKGYKTRKTDSTVFWGSAKGYRSNNYTHLPSEAGAECMAADFNGDGWTDLLILNHLQEGDHHVPGNPSTHVTNSYIYWNSATGFNPVPAKIPSVGAHCNNSVDYGNVYDRKLRWGYRSVPFEFGDRMPSSIHWEAKTPFHTYVRFQIRTAETRAALDTAAWHGPGGDADYYLHSGDAIHAVPRQHRWLQYRLELGIARGTGAPEVTAVELRAAGD